MGICNLENGLVHSYPQKTDNSIIQNPSNYHSRVIYRYFFVIINGNDIAECLSAKQLILHRVSIGVYCIIYIWDEMEHAN